MDEKEEVLRVFAQQKEETINKMVEGSQLYKMIFNKGSYHMKDSNKAPLDMLAGISTFFC